MVRYSKAPFLIGGLSYSPILANNSWRKILDASNKGKAAELWNIGAEKDIILTTGETLTLQIYGFDHDDLSSGGKAGITFGMKNLMAEKRAMSTTNTNVGSFTGTDIMYPWLTGELWNSLPVDLRSAIRTVVKRTSAGDQYTFILSENMSLFLFSEVECFGSITNSATGEGSQYPIFTDAASRIKYQSNGAGSATAWWGRSPVSANAAAFCGVNINGNNSGIGSSGSHGVCFGFCI